MRVQGGDDEVDEVYGKGEVEHELRARDQKQYEYDTATDQWRQAGATRVAHTM